MEKERRPLVALLWGGRGHESEVSRRGKEHILPVLSEKYNILSTFIDKNGDWNTDFGKVFATSGGFYCIERQKFYAIDCAIPLLHGDFGEDGVVQGALENARIPYIGCDTSASAVCRDKSFVKTQAVWLGIPTLPHLLVFADEGVDFALRRAEGEIGYPAFVKPARLGSSVGASAAYNKFELTRALSSAFSLCERVIIEPCLECKRELECGYFSAGGRELYTHPGEILLGGTYGYKEKYLTDTRLSIRADLSREIADSIRDYSRSLVRALGIRDISRIDFFLSGERIYLNEINTLPGFTEGSLYAKMIEAEGIPLTELFGRLIDKAMARA